MSQSSQILGTAQAVAPTSDDVLAAAARIRGYVRRTPLLRDEVLDAVTGARVFLKPENLQVAGAFKIRGASNALLALSAEARSRGVVAFSSGNHAQAVAEAARRAGLAATIVMPADTPRIKLAGVAERGGRIVTYDRASQDREAIARALAEETGAAVIAPFDHADVIAGQGSVGLELIEDARAAGAELDVIICCVGGGGLIAGIALAAEALRSKAAIWSVEPDGFDDTRRSLNARKRLSNPSAAGSICDALLSPSPGVLTFEINRRRLAGGLVVTDAEALATIAFAWRRLKLVLEPGGAVALAAALLGGLDLRGANVGVVLSGGNVDPQTFARALA